MGYRGKAKEAHIKNEDIWREANILPMIMATFLGQKLQRLKGMRWRVPPRRCYAGAGTEKMKEAEAQEKMA